MLLIPNFFLHNSRILKIESEFYKHVDLNQASRKLGLEMEAVDLLYRFWILKRRSLANRPLFIPRADDPEVNRYFKDPIFFFKFKFFEIQNFRQTKILIHMFFSTSIRRPPESLLPIHRPPRTATNVKN